MTSASGLFSAWRSRFGAGDRNPDPGPYHLEVGPALSPDLRRRSRPQSSNRRRGDGCRPSRPRRRLLEPEHELPQSNGGSPDNSVTANQASRRAVRNRYNEQAFIRSSQRSEQLPGTVLQAQARLLERLRGISLTESRQNAIPPDFSWNDLFIENDFARDFGDWGIGMPREATDFDIQLTDFTAFANQAASRLNRSKKPPGLIPETISRMPQENFKNSQANGDALRTSLECAICLEKFQEGNRLFLLPCYHRFHSSCLEPWLQIRGDCPCCRARIPTA